MVGLPEHEQNAKNKKKNQNENMKNDLTPQTERSFAFFFCLLFRNVEIAMHTAHTILKIQQLSVYGRFWMVWPGNRYN